MFARPPRFTLFPKSTLFRSVSPSRGEASGAHGATGVLPPAAGGSPPSAMDAASATRASVAGVRAHRTAPSIVGRSEEHTSELQSRQYLVCRLLLEKKKKCNN